MFNELKTPCNHYQNAVNMTFDQFMYKIFPVMIVTFILAGHFFRKYFPGSTDKKSDDFDPTHDLLTNDVFDPVNPDFIGSSSSSFSFSHDADL
jgi:hypothetical protein